MDSKSNFMNTESDTGYKLELIQIGMILGANDYDTIMPTTLADVMLRIEEIFDIKATSKIEIVKLRNEMMAISEAGYELELGWEKH